jgi:hypothetical protein
MCWQHPKNVLKGEFDMLGVIRAKCEEDDKTSFIIFDKEGGKYDLIIKNQYTNLLQEGNVVKIRSVKDMSVPPHVSS